MFTLKYIIFFCYIYYFNSIERITFIFKRKIYFFLFYPMTGLPLTKEIEVSRTTDSSTISNRVSTLLRKPLRQRVSIDGNGETVTQSRIGFQNWFKPTSVRTSAMNDPTSAFKKDGTAVIEETKESPVRIIDLPMPMSEESTPGTAGMQLFFVLGAIQTFPTWILADSGSVRNLVDEMVYKKLLY